MHLKKKDRLTDRVACLILAGGQGTRLFPLTKRRSKPAVQFGGRYRLIDVPISNALHAHIHQIFILSQYFSSHLNRHIQQTFPLSSLQNVALHFLCPEERGEGRIWYEGTADAVRKNLNTLAKLPVDYFLILSGDQIYHMDLEEMVQFAEDTGADLTIGTFPVKEEETSRLGIVRVDPHGTILDFLEKPTESKQLESLILPDKFIQTHEIALGSSPSFLASMGIYVFKKKTLIDLLKEDGRVDFGMHLIPSQVKRGKAAAFVYQGDWEDIGTISSYYQANLSLTTDPSKLRLYDERLPIYTHNYPLPGVRVKDVSLKQSILCEGAIVEGSKISHSIIGPRCVIQTGTVIKDSILMGNQTYGTAIDPTADLVIGENCLIEKAIIDLDVRIGNDVQLINRNQLEKYDGEGIYIRDGIIIVTSETTLPSGFTL